MTETNTLIYEQSETDISQKLKELLETREQFRYWLLSFDPDEQIGMSGSCSQCPLAQFLKSNGLPDLHVFPSGVAQERSSAYFLLFDFNLNKDANKLDWASTFVWSLDDRYRNGQLVSAENALKVLSHLEYHE